MPHYFHKSGDDFLESYSFEVFNIWPKYALTSYSLIFVPPLSLLWIPPVKWLRGNAWFDALEYGVDIYCWSSKSGIWMLVMLTYYFASWRIRHHRVPMIFPSPNICKSPLLILLLITIYFVIYSITCSWYYISQYATNFKSHYYDKGICLVRSLLRTGREFNVPTHR